MQFYNISFLADPPRILPLLPSTEEWTEGEKRELACHTAGRPKPRVTWKKDDQILKQERKVAVTKLDFPSVTWRDAGLYVCLAENAGGRSQKQVEITVLCKFTFSEFYGTSSSCTLNKLSPCHTPSVLN